jgi:hypothetical protein
MPELAKSSSTDPCASTDEAVSPKTEELSSVQSIDNASNVQSTRAQRARIADVLPPRKHRRHADSPGKDQDDPVNLLLTLMHRSIKAAGQSCPHVKNAVAARCGKRTPALNSPESARAELLKGSRVSYTMPACETLNDVAGAIYENPDVAELIYQLNQSSFETRFSLGLMLRLRLMPGTVLELPSAWESAQFLARSPARRHTFEFDLY